MSASALLTLDPPAVAGITDAEMAVAAKAMGTSGAGGARLVAALLEPELYGPELAARISNEPGIAGRVLRVANSAYFGRSGTVATLERAVQVLGLAAVKGAAAAACMDRLVGAGAVAAGFDLEAFRRHSLATACAGARLARQVAPALAEEAYMAGLLHDLGQVLQWRLRPQAMHQWLQWLADGHVPADTRAAAETRLVGAPHEQCTGFLLRSWQLPEGLVQAVADHHHWPRDASDTPALPRLLACADALASAAGHGVASEALDDRPWRAQLQRWGLDEAGQQALLAALPDDVAALVGALRD
jgi:HD-like signal output (HDOD) protein